MKLLKIFKDVKEVQRKKLPFIIGIISGVFVITFYFSFNYCSVIYYSRWKFVGCLFVGILFDFVLFPNAPVFARLPVPVAVNELFE